MVENPEAAIPKSAFEELNEAIEELWLAMLKHFPPLILASQILRLACKLDDENGQ